MTKMKTIVFDLAKLSVVVGCLEISWYWIRKGHADLFLVILGFLWLNLEVLVEIVDELEDEEPSEGGEAS